MEILNLTQHVATGEQIEAGVFEPANKEVIKDLLTFIGAPTKEEIIAKAKGLAEAAAKEGAEAAMLGGAPYLMGPLEKALAEKGITAVYAFTERVVIEEKTEGGEVIKKSVFKHKGFVEAAV